MMVGMARAAESDEVVRLIPELSPPLGIEDVMVVGGDPAAGHAMPPRPPPGLFSALS